MGKNILCAGKMFSDARVALFFVWVKSLVAKGKNILMKGQKIID